MSIKDSLIAKIESINSVEVLIELHRVIDKLEPIINTLDRLSEYARAGFMTPEGARANWVQVTTPADGVLSYRFDSSDYEVPEPYYMDFVQGPLGEVGEWVHSADSRSRRSIIIDGHPLEWFGVHKLEDMIEYLPVKAIHLRESKLMDVDPIFDEPKWFDSKIVKISSQVHNRRPKNNPLPGRNY